MDALQRLTLGRDLNSTRDADIIEARDAGHTWNEITQATGLSRALVARVYQHRPDPSHLGRNPTPQEPVHSRRT